jgi:signal transduction histidine kinase
MKLGETGSRLRFEVRDDGPGFGAADADGSGLRNMRDRIEAIGGELTIESVPGRGTRVAGWVPLS